MSLNLAFQELNEVKNKLQLLKDGETKATIELMYSALNHIANEVSAIKGATR